MAGLSRVLGSWQLAASPLRHRVRAGRGAAPVATVMGDECEKLWVPSKTKVWRLAKVTAWKQEVVEVAAAEGGNCETVALGAGAPWDASHDEDMDDLAKMNQLHEAPLLAALGRRYKDDAIYTYTGDVLISVNPYKHIPLLYDLPKVDDEEAFEAMDAERPHVYGVARSAQAAVRATERNQSVVVSGESGAGKTEASKKVMAFLLALSAARKDAYAEEARNDAGAVDVDAVLLVSNVILEAFGNAKTIRNDNSSRFGKYIRLVYDADWRIAGAKTDHFLLEKSRLAAVDDGERRGGKRVIQRRFNVGVFEAISEKKAPHALSSPREMIARPKISQIEWKNDRDTRF